MKPIAKFGKLPFNVGGISVFAAVDNELQAITDDLFIISERSTRMFDLVNEDTSIVYSFMKMVSKDKDFKDLPLSATAAEVQAALGKNQFAVKVFDTDSGDALGYAYKFFSNQIILSNGLVVDVVDFNAQTTVPVPPVVPVDGVAVTPKPSAVKVGATVQLTATVSPVGATDKSVTWSSGTPANATVSSTGLVTGVANGTSVITATTTDGSFTDTSTVTVTTAVASVTLAPKTATLSLAGTTTQQLTPTVLPATASVKTVTYTSSDDTKATVSASGLVTAVAVGSATITVHTDDGAKTDTAVITITA